MNAEAANQDPPIPPWDSLGVLPPIRPGQQGHHPDRSPYRAGLRDVVRQFGGTQPRRMILRGLINLRVGLRAIGIDTGFQWLDGSFFERVEDTRGRPPNDIDVVTFTPLGDDLAQQALYDQAPQLFDHSLVKERYAVDHYFVSLGQPMGRDEVRLTGYWYSMWAHRREDQLWKGFIEIEIELENDHDSEVLAILDELDGGGML